MEFVSVGEVGVLRRRRRVEGDRVMTVDENEETQGLAERH